MRFYCSISINGERTNFKEIVEKNDFDSLYLSVKSVYDKYKNNFEIIHPKLDFRKTEINIYFCCDNYCKYFNNRKNIENVFAEAREFYNNVLKIKEV